MTQGILFMDVDGTMTDGSINICESGELYKSFNVKDGYGISNLLPQIDYVPVVLTGRDSLITVDRCRELKIEECYQGIKDKKKKMMAILDKFNLQLSNAAYIGDDLNDIECLKLIKCSGGLTGCPLDAVEEVKRVCSFVSKKEGGKGAIRDFIEYIVANKYLND